jgi:hypothetical protein
MMRARVYAECAAARVAQATGNAEQANAIARRMANADQRAFARVDTLIASMPESAAQREKRIAVMSKAFGR